MNCKNGVLILAGGKSERMRFPKAYLLYNGITFVNKIVAEYYNAGIKNIFLVLNTDLLNKKWSRHFQQIKSYVTLIENPNPELGRFHSLKLGIKNVTHLEYCFIQNIDNPFVNGTVIETLLRSRNYSGYTSPVFMNRRGHPVLISNKIIRHINNSTDGNNNLRNILSGFPGSEVGVKCNNVLMNINTAEDYERYIVKKLIVEPDI